MNWEETIIFIRTQPEYAPVVERAYFDADLELNVSRFENSLEFKETLNVINAYAPQAKTILDIGSGNGISVISFAKHGYQVTAVEPDPSQTVGAGAITILKDRLNLDTVEVFQDFAENIQFEDNSFDVVYVRQAMHHANHLNNFVKECVRVLKPNGLLLTIRDHVIFNDADKDLFFESHPLQKFYGGENAYTSQAYKQAIVTAGAEIKKELKYYDSVINYYPNTLEAIQAEAAKINKRQKEKLRKRLGVIANIPLVWWLYCQVSGFKPLDERQVAGRMYSYIALKK